MVESSREPEAPSPRRIRIGEGRISGILSLFLAVVSLGAVVCFHFPQHLTTPEFREHYPVETLRGVLLACLVLSFVFAFTSFLLSRRPHLAFAGVLVSAVAILLGGPGVDVGEIDGGLPSLSLDWLLIDLLVLSVIFVPIELFLPQRREQTKFHPEWKTDLVYFAIAHLLVQVTAVMVRSPAEQTFGRLGLDSVQDTVASWPFLVQLPLAMLLADLFQYAIHRLFHANRYLWRFHAVHHSTRTLDWLAGSRLHLVDVVITRACSYVPLYVCGFSGPVFYAYVAIVALQAVGAHANTHLGFGWLRHVLVTPQYHHWHHSDDPRFHDRNFAIHFPVLDRLFGTHHLPGDAWPETVGLGKERFPRGYLRQLFHPFRRDPAESGDLDDASER